MPWIARRRMKFRQVPYEKGDVVPADKSANRLALKSTGWIEWRDPEPVAEADGSPKLGRMKRVQLNEFAAELGIEDPASYPNKDALIEAIEAIDAETAPGSDAASQPPVPPQPIAGLVDGGEVEFKLDVDKGAADDNPDTTGDGEKPDGSRDEGAG